MVTKGWIFEYSRTQTVLEQLEYPNIVWSSPLNSTSNTKQISKGT